MSGQRLRNSKICQERYIKVQEAFYEYRLKKESPYAASRSVPWITIRGHRLERTGFVVDLSSKVRVMEGCLVLTAE
ncbi:SymE family type I addiction module toxin [Microbulbifer spongiae]|uniref:Type I toxin-antitoxin system SymE family toxin n=1 Tax=Microbulbifer spongiae TaxID=2944933 RepID=A0ABY9EG35_9GAMM|nr:SymE family type I addiction module toxin [Microbulbifer sp. MI-G]WKD51048.1 type I toxin-antitoxin system SymE family toxin [Microbulbifer sp. MI-G]